MKILKTKINKFIRKYYYNQILTGVIFLVGLFVGLLLLFIFIEYFSWLSKAWRAFSFWSIIVCASFIFIYYIIIPFLKLCKLSKYISESEAAKIIGKYFPEIRDKLLNYLQLENMEQQDYDNQDLVIQSINQKIDLLKPFNFSKAVDFKTTKKYFVYVFPIILIFALLFLIKPVIIKDSAERIINYNKEYEMPQDFYISLINNELQAIQTENYTVVFKLTGKNYPENLMLSFDEREKKQSSYLTKINDSIFQYTFKNINNSFYFRAFYNNISSPKYYLKVIPKPSLINFEITINYPAYTKKQAETIENTGIIDVLYGSRLKWKFYTNDVDGILYINKNTIDTLKAVSSNVFSYEIRCTEEQAINIVLFNNYTYNQDTLKFSIHILDDFYPEIRIAEIIDTLFYKNIYFSGTISDDYGFSSLKYCYRIFQERNDNAVFWNKSIPIDNSVSLQDFYYVVNGDEIGLLPGYVMEYYFEVCDNDFEKGYKCTTSQKKYFNKLSKEEFDEISNLRRENIKNNSNTTLQDIQSVQKDMNELLMEFKQKESLSYKDKEKLEQLFNQQKKIQEHIENQLEQMKIDEQNQNEYNNFNENILEKQQKLEELFNKILNEEMKKLMAELQKMLEDINKDKLDEQLRDLKMSTEEIEKQLDQALELFKRLEFEQEFNKVISKLDSLSINQEKLAELTENSKETDGLSKKQDSINKEYENVREKLDNLNNLNKELEKSHKIDFNKKLQSDTQNELQEAKSKLDKANKKAYSNQKEAQKKMKELSENLQKQYDEEFGNQQAEDASNIRRLLNNIVHLSFKEESFIDLLKSIKRTDPQYVKIILSQNEVNQQLKLVEDSLSTLARRNFEITTIVFDEIKKLKRYSSDIIQNMNDRNISFAANNLQREMTSLNQLALLLSESLDNIEKDDSGMCSASCPNGKKNKKAGNGKPSIETIKQLQEQLNSQMKEMMNGQQQKGKSSQVGPNSERFAKMAAQQESIRRQLEEMQKQLRSEGQNLDGSLQQAIDAMDKSETDLINKRLTEALMKRQEEILTRLLNSDKAIKEREKEEKRESKRGQDIIRMSPEEIFLNRKTDQIMEDKLQTNPPALKSFYKQKVDNYRYNIEKNK